jgi:hypothetical protein
MRMRKVARASLWVMAFTALSCGPEETPLSEETPRTQRAALREDGSPPRVLLLGTTEQSTVLGGMELHAVTPEQWSALPAEQFKEYQALVIGAGGCDEEAARALQAALDNRDVWSAAVAGNVFITAEAADKDTGEERLEHAVAFAGAEEGKTGLYVSLGCGYQRAVPGTSVSLLEAFGAFRVTGLGCHSEQPCEASAVFTQYPDRSFSPAALAWDSQSVGTPYALTRQIEGDGPPPVNSPPVAVCANRRVEAVDTCGFMLDVEDGSYDPDGDVVECSQSPIGPFGAGVTAVTLRCRDTWGQQASCTATVTVVDVNAPTLALRGPPNVAVECATPYTDPGATAYDICEGDISHRVPVPHINTQHPGTTTAVLSVTDTAGNRSNSVVRTVTVYDTLAPTIEVLGPLDDTFECGTTYEDPGAIANDACFGDVTSSIIVTRAGNPRGTFQIAYSAVDPAGNAATSAQVRRVTARDTEPPMLVLYGPDYQRLECGTTYVDPGASANDACAGDVSNRIVRTGTVNNTVPALYTLKYDVTDPSGNSAPSRGRTVEVVDTLAPVITLVGPANPVYECGSGPYPDPGVIVTDQCDGNASVTTSGTVDQQTPGRYSLTYVGSDDSGNVTTPLSRQVTVVDTLPPVISISGPNPETLECGMPYAEPQVSVVDQCDGGRGGVVVKTGTVNSKQRGTYQIIYNASDRAGNVGMAVKRVDVNDTLSPVITLDGPSEQQAECGAPYPELGATAADLCAGDLSGNIVTTRTGNPNAPGTVLTAYRVSDPSGNTATAFRTVKFEDTLPPVMTLVGPVNQTVECGTPYSDPGATAVDECAGDVTASISRSGSVNTAVVGRYTLGYSATDPLGHRSQETLRTVTVADTLAPSIKLLGAASQTVQAGTPYSDPGATAADRCPGTVAVTVTGSVNMSVPGTYVLRYSALDRSGNTSQTLTRTVTVVGAQESLTASSAWD